MEKGQLIKELKECVESFGLTYLDVEFSPALSTGVLYFIPFDKYSYPIALLDKLRELYFICSLGVCGYEKSHFYATFHYGN